MSGARQRKVSDSSGALTWLVLPWFQNVSEEGRGMRYRVHRFELRMTEDQGRLEQFLNSLEGEVVAIIPNVTLGAFWAHRVDFLLIVEKVD
jgi:hypothetical protein